MAAKPHPPLGDVSCRATGYAIQQLQQMKLPTAHVTRGLAYTLDNLQDQSASISWDDYLVFLRNSHEDLTTDKLVELCTSYQGSAYLRPLLSAAGLWFHPARYFERLADPESGAIRQLYRCVKTRFTQLSDLELLFEEVVEPGFAMPPDLFWEAHSIGLGALTTYFGLTPSIVTWEPIERGAAFRVRLPRRRPIRFVLSWLASWFHRDTAEDVRNALLFGHERSLRLEREIAERKVAETALREGEERFRRITEAIPGVIYQYYLDSNGNDGFAFVSHGATDLTGYTPEEVISQPDRIWGRITPDDILSVKQAIMESAQNGTPWQHTFRFQTKTGDTRGVKARSIPEPITASGRIMWNGILNDVTAEKQADLQLHARDALLQKLSEQVPGVIYQYQQWPDGRSCFPYASEGIRDIYEVTPEEVRISADVVFGRLHAEDVRAVAESIRYSLESLEPWRCEYRVQLPQRGLRWLDGHAVPERLPDGSTIWHGYIRDVTERKIAEETLRLKDTAIATSLNAIAITYAEGRIIYVNRSFLQFWGYDHADNILGRTPPELCEHPEQAEAAIQTLRASGDWVGELRGLRRDGTVFDTQVSANLILDRHGRPANLMASFIDITERKLAEESLLASEARYRRAERGTNDGLWEWDIASGEHYFSTRWLELLGYLPGELPNRLETFTERVHPDDLSPAWEAAERHLQSRQPYDMEIRLRRKDDDYLWVRSRGQAEWNAAGKPVRMTGSITDITERRLTEQALRESEYRLGQAIRVAQIGIFDHDHRTDEIYWSREQQIINGWPEKKQCVALADYIKLVHPDDRERIAEAVRQAHDPAGDGLFDVEHRIIRTDGTHRWLDTRSQTYFEGEGTARQPVRTVGAVLDVTDRKQTEYAARRARDSAEQALADLQVASTRAEQFYRLCEAAGQGIGISRLDGSLTYMNPAFLRMLEIPDGDDVTQRAFWELVPSENHQFLAESVLTQTQETGSWSGEFDLLTLTGKRVPIINTVVLLRDPDGTVFGYSNIATDITEQRRAAQDLRESELRYRTLIETSSDAIFLMDMTGRIRAANATAVRTHGYTMEELLSMRMQELDVPDDAANLPDRMRRLRAGESLTFEVAHRRKDGTTFPLEVIASAIEIGGEWLVIGFNRDITERKAAERALVEEKSLLQAMFGSLPGIAFAFDQSGRFIRWNHNYDNLLGWSDEEMTRLTALDTIALRDRERIASVIRDVFMLGESASELHALRKDGCELPLYCTGVRVSLGGEPCVVGFGIDISDRLEVEAALRASEERLRIFVESAPAGVAMFDRDMRYISYSRRWLTDYGLGDQNLIGRSHYEVFPEVTDQWKEIHRRCLTGVSEQCEQDRFERADGTLDYLRWEIQPWTNETGAVGGLVFLTEMITDRVCAEEQIRASLREKEAMLKEIHHRVKNNLQVISSLLSLQAAQVTTHPVAADILAESQNRVRAMALVHETLYRSDDLARVDLSRYIEELCGYLFRSYGVDSARVGLVLDVESVTVSLEKTIPCGLLMNEIVSNSLKYAFPGTRSGTVSIRARMQSNGLLTLTLADDGVGLPNDLVIDNTPTLGLQLINILTDQLGGQLTLDRFRGTRFDLSFTP